VSSERAAAGPGESPGVFSRLPAGAKVLVIRLRSMGDTILMTPALRLLHEWRPDLKVTVLAEHPWNELLEGNPAVHSAMVWSGKLSAAWELRRAGFALAINLHGGPTSAFLTRASGARWRAGFEHFRNRFVYNLHVPTAQKILGWEGAVHTAEHVASCFFWLGLPAADIPAAQLFPSPQAAEIVRTRLLSMGLEQGEDYAVIHPAASYASKQWKASGFAEVGEYLESKSGLRPVYICGRGESEILAQVEGYSRHPLLRAEGWEIRELVALIARARIFVGNDAGPAHLAAASGVPVLVIFGSSNSVVWRPWKAAGSVTVQNYLECNPCPGDRCYVFDEPRCILSVTTEQVKEGLERLLRAGE
jgi:heptosyltransferase-3